MQTFDIKDATYATLRQKKPIDMLLKSINKRKISNTLLEKFENCRK